MASPFSMLQRPPIARPSCQISRRTFRAPPARLATRCSPSFMSPYLDADFLLTLLVDTNRTHSANVLLRRLAGPLQLNALHQLQAENLIMRRVRSSSAAEQEEGERAFRLWNQYHAEAVFVLTAADWETAYDLALNWNRNP